MRRTLFSLCGLTFVAGILCGCGESKPAAPGNESKPSAAPTADIRADAPTSAAPVASAAPVTADTSQPATPAPTPVDAAKAAGDDATSQFAAAAKTQGDTVAASIGSDLVDKVKTLTQSAAGNDALKSQLTGSLQSLASGNDAAGLSSLYQAATAASLTPPQLQLAKDVGNLASAYVVQKNFASLAGAQSDVATIVNSLRQGQITPALPALQKVAQNASLTPSQKQLVASIADKYAPGISKATSALQQGLQGVPGLGGASK